MLKLTRKYMTSISRCMRILDRNRLKFRRN
nr:MAG TPA_asm: hypothetical protein [Caudoviricetes sp.]